MMRRFEQAPFALPDSWKCERCEEVKEIKCFPIKSFGTFKGSPERYCKACKYKFHKVRKQAREAYLAWRRDIENTEG